MKTKMFLINTAKTSVVIAALASTIGCTENGEMMNHGMMNDDMMNSGTTLSYPSNGETIFRTGKNKQEQIMQDIAKSQMKMAHSCQYCHGADGKGMIGGGMMNGGMPAPPSIRYVDLSNPQLHSIPYNDSLIIRFLDHELKSDGTPAQTGVAWKMSMQDKLDLIAFLKTL